MSLIYECSNCGERFELLMLKKCSTCNTKPFTANIPRYIDKEKVKELIEKWENSSEILSPYKSTIFHFIKDLEKLLED